MTLRVQQLWRHPVKSLAGEALEHAHVERRGIVGDRLWAVRDDENDTITSAKRLPALLRLRARFVVEPRAGEAPHHVPAVVIGFPDGSELESGDRRVHTRLSELVGRRVSLVPLRPKSDRRHYRALQADKAALRQTFGLEPGEPIPDLSMLPVGVLALLSVFATPPGSYFDVFPLHLLTTASLRALGSLAPGVDFDVRRFRPNVLLECEGDGFVEATWAGSALTLGSARARIECATVRCSMPARAQLDLPADPDVMKVVAREAERCLGIYASVPRPGRVSVGERVDLEPARDNALARRLDRLGTAAKRGALRLVERLLPERRESL